MGDGRRQQRGIELRVPGMREVRLLRAVFDFNGTLAADGTLLPGIASRLRRLTTLVEIDVLTADTFGTARRALASVPVSVRMVRTGADKRRFVSKLGEGVVAVGNGRNDVPMFRAATLSVAVIGAEGAAGAAIAAATIVVRDARDALDLLLRPKRLIATLRH